MKLRIRDNSIRMRLTQTEVDTIAACGLVKSRVSMPGGAGLDYVLESSASTDRPTARFSNDALTVHLPESDVREWASSEQVSITGDEILDDGDILKILVEKDFACLAPRDGEDESDMFPNPLEEQN
jgi:hypothetical protein